MTPAPRPAPLVRLLNTRRNATLIAAAWVGTMLAASQIAPAPTPAPMATVETLPRTA